MLNRPLVGIVVQRQPASASAAFGIGRDLLAARQRVKRRDGRSQIVGTTDNSASELRWQALRRTFVPKDPSPSRRKHDLDTRIRPERFHEMVAALKQPMPARAVFITQVDAPLVVHEHTFRVQDPIEVKIENGTHAEGIPHALPAAKAQAAQYAVHRHQHVMGKDSSNNRQLRELLENARLKQSTALTLLNRGRRSPIPDSTFRAWLAKPNSSLWLAMTDEDLADCKRAFADDLAQRSSTED